MPGFGTYRWRGPRRYSKRDAWSMAKASGQRGAHAKRVGPGQWVVVG